MASLEMIMPKMGESIFEATVIKWLKKEGDIIEKDESVLEVATDKVDTEVPAASAGILSKILIKDGQVAKVGETIAIIDTDKQVSITSISNQKIESAQLITSTIENAILEMVKVQDQIKPAVGRFYSPLVLNIARSEGLTMSELEAMKGSGKDNRVTKEDILSYVANRKSTGSINAEINDSNPITDNLELKQAVPEKISFVKDLEITSKSYSGPHEIIEMDRMRKIISDRMLDSQRVSATVTSFVEADVTNMVIWKNKIKHEFMKREGEGMTYTPIFIEAISRALKDYPLVNSSVEGDKIILKKNINIGIAVALNDGNLIVPVLKNADRYNITGLTKACNELIKKTKAGKLTPDDLSDGTYSMSNVGSFGNVMGTPILVQPQVGIMALGTIKKKPAVIETDQGDTIGIRHMMFLSHSYDHRIIDGSLGGSFVRRVADYLEDFDVNRKL